MLIDATGLIVGRLATVAAKKALLGEKVDIINCEKAILSGSREDLTAQWKRKRIFGTWSKGPFYSRLPDRMVRRIIRGMLPYKNPRGRAAFERIMCYRGVPMPFKDQKTFSLDQAHVKKLPTHKFMSVGEISKLIGGKNG